MPPRRANDVAARAKPFVDKIEGINADIESEKARFMAFCKGKRKLVKDAYAAAKDNDVAVEPLKGLIKRRALERKITKIGAGFEDFDEAETYKHLCATLGELGSSAAIRAGYGDANGGQPTAAERKAERQRRETEENIDTVGRGPVTS